MRHVAFMWGLMPIQPINLGMPPKVKTVTPAEPPIASAMTISSIWMGE